jgi:tRNA A-37 threonylcarbamoyl transferase component Bud32
MVKIVNQGAYGCIFYPGFTCDGKLRKRGDKYITKVQRKMSTSRTEEDIGKIIATIKNYDDYYAPVIESCPVAIATLQNDEMKRCDFLRDPKARELTYQSNKIKYVGKHSLGDYLFDVSKKHPKQLYRRIVTSYLHLLQGLTGLSDKNIVHYDIKDNNVIVQTKTGNPIFIDFGLSIDQFPMPDYTSFYTYSPDYEPWCFDICLINHILHKAVDKTTNEWETTPISKNMINDVLDEFLMKNTAWVEYFSEEERKDYRTRLQPRIESWDKKPAGEIMKDVVAGWKSWDNYAVAVLFLGYFHSFELDNTMYPNVQIFVSILKTICMSSPVDRPTASETMSEIKTKLKKINRRENNASKTAISDKFKKEGVLQKAIDSFHELRKKSEEKNVIRQQVLM